jgi:hypothetical protein
MARKAFFSFYYRPDAWRVQQIQKMGELEGQPILSSNQWEEVKRGGDSAIRRWITNQMKGKSCVVVLIGSRTAGRPWVDYEIQKGWREGKGVVGVHIHNLKNTRGLQAAKGANPFASFQFGEKTFSSIVKAYDPPSRDSKKVYAHIQRNLADWVEEAIRTRKRYS